MVKRSFEIVFENNHFIVVNKAAGVLSIPDREGKEKSLKSLLQGMYTEIFTVHRLDRQTSGLIVFAKNEETHKHLSKEFEERSVEKFYLGVVNGTLSEKKGMLDLPLMQHPSKNGMMVVNKKGKEAITHFEVLEEFGKFSFVKFRIQTGRTHQIRVHMQYAGNPLVCDELYGDSKPILLSSIKKKFYLSKSDEEERPLFHRLGLHSSILSFKDIEDVYHSFEAPLPKDMKAFLQQLRKVLTPTPLVTKWKGAGG